MKEEYTVNWNRKHWIALAEEVSMEKAQDRAGEHL